MEWRGGGLSIERVTNAVSVCTTPWEVFWPYLTATAAPLYSFFSFSLFSLVEATELVTIFPSFLPSSVQDSLIAILFTDCAPPQLSQQSKFCLTLEKLYSLFFSFHHRRCRSSSVRHKNLKCLPRLWMKIFQDKSTDFAFIKEQKQTKTQKERK